MKHPLYPEFREDLESRSVGVTTKSIGFRIRGFCSLVVNPRILAHSLGMISARLPCTLPQPAYEDNDCHKP